MNIKLSEQTLKKYLSNLVIGRQDREMDHYAEISNWSILPLETLKGIQSAFKENNEVDKWIEEYLTNDNSKKLRRIYKTN